ncbi:putative quinol monooxygenase [Polaribacter sp. Q13]|uniref:putative quinol monooxygenase n=1 Tax=Polaribacter sp. Q13 TaxID=2806551 RepID=UPI00193C57FA|nr:putative quinol monooxygenase [Polaribacter sp. Q13]QVY66314.1 antibiotic biosynthesis monooxygenase [Polaribacter sp. Q13]
MSKITVVAKIVAKEENRELVKTELLKLVASSVKEAGCINYNCLQDNDDSNTFTMYENWKDAEALTLHAATPHYVAFQTGAKDAIAEFTVNKMTMLA